MKSDANDKDLAFNVMAMDILSNVLSRANNPAEMGSYLTEEVRDLTGAHCVILIECLSTPTVQAHRVVSVNPLRRLEWAKSPEGNRLYDVVHRASAAQLWRREEPSEMAGLLRQEGFEISMVFPLTVGEFRVGALLVLGLPDEEHITAVRNLLNNLSTIVALVLRNTILYEKQEQVIQERTTELRDNNMKLAMELRERKRAEEALHRLNRELKAISNCNQVLMRAEDEQNLLNNICRIVCDEAGYRMAWVGYAEHDDAKAVRPVAWAGSDSGYIVQAKPTWDDKTEDGRGPIGQAIRSRKSIYVQDFASDAQMTSWRKEALQYGYHSSIALPLKDESENAFGVLNIYSSEPNTFTPAEIKLLEELAGDLAFGIVILRARDERIQAEKKLGESEGRFRRLAENARDVIYRMLLPDGQYEYVSSAALSVLGYSPEEFLQTPLLIKQIIHPDWQKYFEEQWTNLVKGEMPPTYEYQIVHKLGEVRWLNQRNILICNDAGNPIAIEGIITDITEHKRAEEALKEQYSTLRGIIDYANALIFSVDRQYRYTSFNKGHAEVMQVIYGAKIQPGISILDYMTVAEDRENAKQNLDRALAGERLAESAYSGEEVRSRLYFEVSHSPILAEDGAVIGVAVLSHDITEQKKAEEAIRQYALIVEYSDDAIISKSLEGTILTWNKGAERIYGYSTEEAIGQSISILIPPECPNDEAEILSRIVNGEHIDHFETLRMRKNSQRISVSLTVSPVKDATGKIISASAIARDITKQKRAEEALRASDERYRMAQTIGHVGNWEYNLQTTEFWGSDEAKQLYGFNPRQGNFSTEEVEKCIPERERVHQALVDLIEIGKPYNLEFEIFPRDSSTPKVISSIAELQKDENGNPIKVLGVIQDITERKRAEEALLAASSYNRRLIEVSIDPLVTIGQDGKITDTNVSTEQVTGCTRDELIGTDFSDYFTEPKKAREGYQQVFSQGFVRDYPLEIRHRSGKVTEVLYNASVYRDDQGKAIGVFAAARDITERKRAEEEVRKLNRELEQRVADRTAQLVAANKELEAFAYSVSHDLRAPLRHIDGFVEMLQKGMKTTLDDQNQHYMAVIADSAKKMGTLIDDLLSFSRMGRNEMVKLQVDLDDLVQDVIEEFRPETEGRDIQWEISKLPMINGDSAMLRVVLVNLISNALKFTRLRSQAKIEIGWMAGPEKETIIFVRDNGVGFDMVYVDKLFNVFQRLHHADEFEGSGIGLANVHRIITRHGGRTWAEGEVDHGATFYFSLPQINRQGA